MRTALLCLSSLGHSLSSRRQQDRNPCTALHCTFHRPPRSPGIAAGPQRDSGSSTVALLQIVSCCLAHRMRARRDERWRRSSLRSRPSIPSAAFFFSWAAAASATGQSSAYVRALCVQVSASVVSGRSLAQETTSHRFRHVTPLLVALARFVSTNEWLALCFQRKCRSTLRNPRERFCFVSFLSSDSSRLAGCCSDR